MFSEVQREWIAHFVKSNFKDYPYYIAYTNTNFNQTSSNDYNFYIIISKDKITANSRYSYTLQNLSNCICLGVRSSNASYNYHNERVVNQSLSSTNISIDNYEFVYTNAEFQTYSMQPNVLQETYVTESTFNGVSIALFIVLLSVLLFKFIGGR